MTCEVTPHHFTLTDEQLSYDTNYKMNPPLRETADRDAMIEGLVDGTIDVIATDHAPHHADEKAVEFDKAPFGIVGLETAVPLVLDRLMHRGLVPIGRLVELLAVNPARILSRAGGSLTPGSPQTSRFWLLTRRRKSPRRPFGRSGATRRSTVGACAVAWRRPSSAGVRCM